MGIFQRMVNGWKLAVASFQIIERNKELLIFPLLSILSMLSIVGIIIFYGGLFGGIGGFESYQHSDHYERRTLTFILFFIFYLANSFITIFFNVALIHCAFEILSGKRVTVRNGIEFSLSRLKLILTWALVSATIHILLKSIERKHAVITNIITASFGLLWSLATFLVLPVMVYENLGVVEAIKRSTLLFKNTWGERVGAGFSFGAIGFILFCAIGFLFGSFLIPINFFAFLFALLCIGLIISCFISTVETVFLASVYQYAAGIPVEGDNKVEFGNIFIPKI